MDVGLKFKIMKLSKIIFAIVLSIIIFGCTSEGTTTELELTNKFQTIDRNESPELSSEQARQIGFENVVNDYSRATILDKENSILKVPFDLKESKKIALINGRGVGICIEITIARLNSNNNGSCQGGCFECIGFRCGFIVFGCPQQRNNYEANEELSRDREQIAEVIVNEDEEVIEYNFYNNIDWEYLENN